MCHEFDLVWRIKVIKGIPGGSSSFILPTSSPSGSSWPLITYKRINSFNLGEMSQWNIVCSQQEISKLCLITKLPIIVCPFIFSDLTIYSKDIRSDTKFTLKLCRRKSSEISNVQILACARQWYWLIELLDTYRMIPEDDLSSWGSLRAVCLLFILK